MSSKRTVENKRAETAEQRARETAARHCVSRQGGAAHAPSATMKPTRLLSAKPRSANSWSLTQVRRALSSIVRRGGCLSTGASPGAWPSAHDTMECAWIVTAKGLKVRLRTSTYVS